MNDDLPPAAIRRDERILVADSERNPLLAEFTLPHGLPPFGDIREEHFAPALEAGMAEQLGEVHVIADDPEPPTFANTLVALERSGRLLDRATSVFYNLTSSTSTPGIQQIEAEFAPKMAAHTDAIRLNRALFDRIDQLQDRRDELGLSDEQHMLLQRYHTDFVLAGARLAGAGAARLRELNQQIAAASTRFHQNLQAATEAAAILVDDVADLIGLSEGEVAGLAQAAAARGHPGQYLITLILPSGQPVLAHLANRDLRRRVHQASMDRAGSGEHDNGPVAIEIARLRAERAALLGFATHADVTVADQTAKTSSAVDALLARLVPPAVANAAAEAEILRQYAERDGIELQPWDWAFYAEKVRAEQYAVDTAALRPYFELDRVLRDGVFYAAQQVYGITLRPRPDLHGYLPEVRVWEVFDSGGASIGLFLGDYYARAEKRGGAWMNSFVGQSELLGTRPVVVNNLNITKPSDGEPTLLTLDEVHTLFHEFGHALHGLLSAGTYPRLSGTHVPRDVVEFPSQVNEMWVDWPDVLPHYARHIETGEPLEQARIDALKAARLWGEGFATTEYLAATLLDLAWYRITAGTEITGAAAFEKAALAAAGVDLPLIPPRYRTSYFQHIFAGGYSAGYYSYIWAEVLDADTVEWFTENGGMTRANGDAFSSALLSRGGSVDVLEAFRALRGRDADVLPLLRRRGLTAPADAAG